MVKPMASMLFAGLLLGAPAGAGETGSAALMVFGSGN